MLLPLSISDRKMSNAGTILVPALPFYKKLMLRMKGRFTGLSFVMCGKARPVSRVLSRMAIYPDAKSPTRSSDTAGTERAALYVPYILHRMGFT